MDLILPKHEAEKTNMALKVLEALELRYERWGKPEFDIKSASFWEFVYDLVNAWSACWPKELDDWKHDRLIDLKDEKSLGELVKTGFKKSMAYPPHLFKLFKAYWPHSSLGSKEFTQQFTGRFPVFRNSNYT